MRDAILDRRQRELPDIRLEGRGESGNALPPKLLQRGPEIKRESLTLATANVSRKFSRVYKKKSAIGPPPPRFHDEEYLGNSLVSHTLLQGQRSTPHTTCRIPQFHR